MMIVSVVSHGQNGLAAPLIRSLLECASVDRVFLTCNLPDDAPVPPVPRLEIIVNDRPKGFGANHNQAFRRAQADYPDAEFFCILNPDIALSGNPFPRLLEHLTGTAMAIAAPQIMSPLGIPEDSARKFPTVWGLALKLLGLSNGIFPRPPYGAAFEPDWVAGMFMLVKAREFAAIGGFDERFFLYYEDVDLCWRLRRAGKTILCDPAVSAVHDARRESHRNTKYLIWHLRSMATYFWFRLRDYFKQKNFLYFLKVF